MSIGLDGFGYYIRRAERISEVSQPFDKRKHPERDWALINTSLNFNFHISMVSLQLSALSYINVLYTVMVPLLQKIFETFGTLSQATGRPAVTYSICNFIEPMLLTLPSWLIMIRFGTFGRSKQDTVPWRERLWRSSTRIYLVTSVLDGGLMAALLFYQYMIQHGRRISMSCLIHLYYHFNAQHNVSRRYTNLRRE